MLSIKIQVETEKVEALMQLLNESGLVSDIEVLENAQNSPNPAPIPTANVVEMVTPEVVISTPESVTEVITPAPVVETAPEIKISISDFEDVNLKPMTATDFYKKVNASNLAQKEKRLFSQNFMEKEVTSW